ncbi:MAG: SDR family NAD(P)-dependent oxidoreductase, partial [Gammaproteobacteria bacterium]|nr:SDR family NAD(P)-dependent oxidoreductase [Gammaproteobacteria bacterium]
MVSTDLFDLTGKVAVLTGASKGMGKAMAEGLAEHGAKVMISSRKLDQCEAAAQEINEKCGEERVYVTACNAGYKEQLQALVDATHDKLGLIDILICNAGV